MHKQSKLINLIKSGKVGILPTDTLYGLVASVKNINAINRLYELKSRERKPGTVIFSNPSQLKDLGVDNKYLKQAIKYWSQPISIIMPVDDKLFYLHQGVSSLAFRLVRDKNLVKLLNVTGPLMTSSANLPGKQPATTITEAKSYFDNKVDFYIDGGDLTNRQASTIIRLKKDGFEVIRQGSVPLMQY